MFIPYELNIILIKLQKCLVQKEKKALFKDAKIM